MADWPRVFLLTAVLGVGIIAYAAFLLLAAALDAGSESLAATAPWAKGGLVLVIAAWVLGVGREFLVRGGRSVSQSLKDAGFWTDGKKP